MSEPERGLAADQAFLQTRTLALAVLLSAVVIAAVGVVLTLGGSGVRAEEQLATVLFGLWVAAAIGMTAGWWILSRRAAGLGAAPGARVEIEAGRLGPGRVLHYLVAAYALLEAQLVVAFAASFLQGTPMLLVPALAIVALGVLLSFPQREWFAPFEPSAR